MQLKQMSDKRKRISVHKYSVPSGMFASSIYSIKFKNKNCKYSKKYRELVIHNVDKLKKSIDDNIFAEYTIRTSKVKLTPDIFEYSASVYFLDYDENGNIIQHYKSYLHEPKFARIAYKYLKILGVLD